MNIVIIGASFAGLSAALECRKLYQNAQITLIDREKDVAYFPNTLNWKVAGKISGWEEAKISLFSEVQHAAISCLLKQNVSQFIPKCER